MYEESLKNIKLRAFVLRKQQAEGHQSQLYRVSPKYG